jgi:hypothetical protein
MYLVQRERIQQGHFDTGPIPPKTQRLGSRPPLHNHAVAQTGRFNCHAVIIQRAVWERRPDSISARIVFRTRTRCSGSGKYESESRGKANSRVDETSEIAHSVSQIHPGYHSRKPGAD